MDLDHFFSLSDASLSDALSVRPADPLDDVRLIHGLVRTDHSIIFRTAGGSQLTDIITTGFAKLFLISEQFISTLELANATGWGVFPVEIIYQGDSRISGYSGLSITGRCGPLDESKIPIVQMPSRSPKGFSPYRIGYYFDITTWDGSDLFSPAPNKSIFVTERLKEAADVAKLVNVSFQRITEIQQLVVSPETRQARLARQQRTRKGDPNSES